MATQFPASSFVPTTNTFDLSTIYNLDPKSDEFKDFLVKLNQNITNIAQSLNARDSGYYIPQEFINGQVWFPNPTLNSITPTAPSYRQVFRLVINFGALPNTGTKTVAHGLTLGVGFTFTRIYATASDTTGKVYLPIPYASGTAADNVELWVDATNVNIKTGKDRTASNICYAVLEYIKQ
jgi:hypothetical protein